MNYKIQPNQHIQLTSPTHSQGSTARPRVSWSRKIGVHVIAIASIALVAIPLWQTYQQRAGYQTQYEQANTEKQQAVQQNRAVFQVVQQLKDPAFLEDVARRDYYYSKQGEIIFKLGSDADNQNIFNQ